MPRTDSGCPEPLGVTLAPGGVNVAVFSAHAAAIELCLFDESGMAELARVPLPERTGDVYHGFIADIDAGRRYGLRARGPYDPRCGHRFNPAKLLVDPYARALDRPFALHPSLFGVLPDGTRNASDSAPFMPKAIVLPGGAEAPVRCPRVSNSRAIVYELHVRGFTKMHLGIPPALRGTCAALTHPAALAHLVRLGITTVELMPVAAAIDDWHLAPLGLANYWGYNPVAMMVPDMRLAPGGIAELASCVSAFHDAGIEVLLDVVLNHTGEGDERGPTLSLRGLDNATYYRNGPDGRYVNDTGCGNTLALDRPPAMRLALDALRYYAVATGIDGFRFDLATTLGRTNGGFDPAAPLLAAIAQDPVLRMLKLVAEPWDVGEGGYRLGAFPATWGEWNDRYRDTVRRFWRGDAGMAGELATRMAGSADVFAARRRPPTCSVNFIAAHDGFTLRDLVAFQHKHNEANGENNRDGAETNYSWNHGVEGASADPAIEDRRRRDVRSLLATLFVSRGTPMLAMGDESGRSQDGNNNAYAQDNATTWLEWSAMDNELVAFVATLAALRQAHPALGDDRWLRGEPIDASGVPDVEWRRADGCAMSGDDWAQPERHVVIAVLYVPASDGIAADHVVIALNAGENVVAVRWPDPRDGFRWRRAIDTALRSGVPGDRGAAGGDPVEGRSVVILVEEAEPESRTRNTGIEPQVLDRLARAAGIASQWRGVDGQVHAVGDDTRRALLAAMGLAATTTGQARAHLVQLASRRERRILPRARVVVEGAEEQIGIVAAGGKWPRRGALEIRGEAGEVRSVSFSAEDLSGDSIVAADGGSVIRRFVPLPSLAAGIYAVTFEGRPDSTCRLVVTPRSCFLPDVLRNGGRRFGLAAHLYALRRQGDQGIGDFSTLREAGVATAGAGGVVVALNPLHALFSGDRERASPYQPSDRRFLDPIYIDVECVPDFAASPRAQRALEQQAKAILHLSRQSVVDYAGVWRLKQAVLGLCFQAFEQRGRGDRLVLEFDRFLRAGSASLLRFATFEAISAVHRIPWASWPETLRQPEGRAVAEFGQSHVKDVRFAMYLQWLADRQLGLAAANSRDRGLAFGFCRDLAVGAAPDGAEAWATQVSLARGVSIGAPPDPFASAGQVWNLPPPIPEAQADEGFAGFRELIRANVRHAGALRIDHVMGLSRLFWIPDGARCADGAYVNYPLDDLLGVLALESERARCVVIGEDLGTVPEGFRERVARADILSYQPLWFQRDGAAFLPPSGYAAKAVACVSTHDLPTFAGWWNGSDIAERQALRLLDDDAACRAPEERRQERDALVTAMRDQGIDASATQYSELARDLAATCAVHRFVGATSAMLVLLQADDLAVETIAQNLPGTDRERPNWRRKVSVPAAELWHSECGEVAVRDLAPSRGRAPGDGATDARSPGEDEVDLGEMTSRGQTAQS
jgi:glycogen operon protein